MFKLKHTLLFLIISIPLLSAATKFNRDSLQRVLYITNQPSEKIVLLNLLSEDLMEDNPEKAYDLAQQAFSLSKTIDDKQGKAEALFNMATYSSVKQDHVASINYFLEALQGFIAIDDEKWQAKTYLELGMVYKKKFEFEKSLDALYKAMSIFEKIDRNKKLAYTYNQIGGVYYDQENYEKASEYFQKSLEIWIKIGDNKGLAALYNNVGEIYRLTGDYYNALEFFNNAILISQKLNLRKYLAVSYDNVGNIYTVLGGYDSALFYLNKSLTINQRINNSKGTATVSVSLGNLYYNTKEYQKAIKYYETGFQIAKKNGFLNLIKEASIGISGVYKDKNQFKDALYYHRLYQQTSDSLYTIKNVEKITQLEMSLIFDHEQELKSIKRQKRNYIYFLIASGILFLFILFFLLYGRMRIKINHSKIEAENLQLEKKRLNEEIDFKNRELTTNVMYLVKKYELINFISDKLIKAQVKFKKENQKQIQKIILDLQSNIDTNIWKNFEERFKDVHQDFYHKLDQKFSHLTGNDRKLCAFLKLNMSTKDIAAITHQNPNSIEVARTRLRKKLNISNTDISLVSFLSSI
jgi:tetratricopeptide (TPR) repeat protein